MLYDTIKNWTLSDDACFLCGQTLNPESRADEHVIPRWAQARYELWNQQLTLLNRTSIPYRQLTIPCCFDCNNGALQPIENAMSQAVLDGPQAVRQLDRLVTFTWLGKIFYGLLHRELFLVFNREVPDEGTITSTRFLEEFTLHHYFLQNVRVSMEFEADFPASIFIYETKVPSEAQNQWDFRDNVENMFVSVRMGSVGIIGVLQDGGAQELMRDEFEELLVHPLHPIQHIELSAMVCYKSLLLNRTPKYLIGETEPIKVFQMPLGGLSSRPIFDEWDPEIYAKILGGFTGLPAERLYASDRGTFTWLRNPDGTPNDLGFERFPWPPIGEELE